LVKEKDRLSAVSTRLPLGREIAPSRKRKGGEMSGRGTRGAGGAGGGGGAGGRSWEKGFYATHRGKLFLIWLLVTIATLPAIVYVFSSHPIAIIIGLTAAVLACIRLSIWEIELEKQKRQKP